VKAKKSFKGEVHPGRQEQTKERFMWSCRLAFANGRRCAFLQPIRGDERFAVFTVPDTRDGGIAARRLLRTLRLEEAIHAALVQVRGTTYVVCTALPSEVQVIVPYDGADEHDGGPIVSKSLELLVEPQG